MLSEPQGIGCLRASHHWQKDTPMLLLTRRPGEEIVIIDKDTGEEIVIAVLRHPKHQTGIGQIGIGIEASRPRFEIYRRELLERQTPSEAS